MEPMPSDALLASYPPGHQEIANALRRLVKQAVPEAIERVRPGWGLIGYDVPVGRRSKYFAWVWPEQQHVHLGFQDGVLMDDPDGVLLGVGITKKVRWLTLRRRDEIREAEFAALVREAARVAGMTQSERFARLLDREEATLPPRPAG